MAMVDDYYNHPHVAAQIFPDYRSAVQDSTKTHLDGFGLGYLGASIDELQALVEQQRVEMEKQLRSIRLILAFATLVGVGGSLIGISLHLRGK
jgi:hypothetical protein